MREAIIGIGNILQRDDGIGVWTVQELIKEGIEGVEIIDGGTAVYDLVNIFMNFDRLIIVDSLKAGHEPGTIYRLSANELEYREGKSSLHEIHFLDLLKMIQKLGHNPEVTVIGIEPEEICYEMEMTDTLKGKMPQVIELIKEEIGYYKDEVLPNA